MRQETTFRFYSMIQLLIKEKNNSISRQDIVVGYRKAESQNQWEPFLADICKKLNIDFIFTILDRSDNAPVWR